ncbi:ATP-binding protein [Asticcacaulis sp. ZE23SCel15]|uniref:sensor histidine kinase n=1 Tax=Asticcacaulis sp. ZE23SCel15 TaxID=3059027 RepID=UPI00266053E3|nr:ATP-binding protein [Asticcacaulis sp. ZE23SCel15]WKL56974.1 ATP-binding protein [Asticcacaulis sp. ZE23SCel15]
MKPEIFEKFHSGKAAADRDGSGTGLGLAICRGIVEAHGGMIYAKNNPPKDDAPSGASFIFTLPIAK